MMRIFTIVSVLLGVCTPGTSDSQVIAFAQMTTPMTIQFQQNMSDPWTVVVDGVMGGRSTGKITLREDYMSFSGRVSLENNGGFSSIRAPWGPYDLSEYSEVTVRYRATGQSFYLTMQHHSRWYMPNHRLQFDTSEDWITVTIPLADMKETRIGEPTGRNITPDVLSRILRMGIITGDKRASSFTIDIDHITFS